MKLLENYSLKKWKSNETISFTFPIIDILIEKRLADLASRRLAESTTPRVDDSPTRRLPDPASRRLPDSASRRLPTRLVDDSPSRWEKKDSIEIVFSHTKVVFPLRKSRKRRFFAQKRPLNLSKVYR